MIETRRDEEEASMIINASNVAVQCRRRLFHEQIGRFCRCEYRKPTWNEMRDLWQSTGFKTR